MEDERIKKAKQDWADANARGDKAGMEKAHTEAEKVRAESGYSGGADGSQRISLNKESEWIGNGGKSGGTSTNYGSYKDDIERLSNLQKKQQQAQLKSARDKALQTLQEQEEKIKPIYQEQRNLAFANSQQGARSFAEYLANRGLTNSGASVQGEINRLSALQNTMGQLGTAEANAFRDIENQRTAAQNDYISNLAMANADIEANYFANLLAYNEQQRQMKQQLELQAMGQYSNDYQVRINELLAQGYSPNSLEVLQLQALRGQKMNQNYANSQQNALASIQAGNINYNNAAAMGWTVEQAQRYYNELKAEQERQRQQEAELLDYQRQQDAIKNAQTWAQINNTTKRLNFEMGQADVSNIQKPISYSTHKEIIDNNYADYEMEVPNYDKSKIEQYIKTQEQSGRISKNDAESLRAYYGINSGRTAEQVIEQMTLEGKSQEEILEYLNQNY